MYQTARSEAQQAFGKSRRVYGEIPRAPAAHRNSGAGRPTRESDSSRRARVHHPAAPSKADGGVAFAGAGRKAPERTRGTKWLKALEKVGYTNAGTVEFLMDEDGELYFIEMNTRIQVEHPVTEFVTGLDLVKAQIRIAAGENMEEAAGEMQFLRPFDRVPDQCRGSGNFCALGGTYYHVSGAREGLEFAWIPRRIPDAVIPPYYDSLVAKLIVKGRDRAEAIGRMKRALEMFVIEGIKTSIPLQRRILADPDFACG